MRRVLHHFRGVSVSRWVLLFFMLSAGRSFAQGVETAQPTRIDPGCVFCGSAPRAATLDDRLWHLDRLDQASPNLDGAYHYRSDGHGVYVYIVDIDGVMRTHTEFGDTSLEQANHVLDGHDAWIDRAADDPAVDSGATKPCGGFPEKPDLDIWPTDYVVAVSNDGHATSVASLVNGRFSGVAKGAVVIPVKVADCGARVRPRWERLRPYKTGALVKIGDGVYHAMNDGVSGEAEPAPVDRIINDGTVNWAIHRPDPGVTDAFRAGVEWVTQDIETSNHRPAVVVFSDVVAANPKTETALRCLLAKDVVIVASANNGNVNACGNGALPISLAGSYSGSLGRVIGVGGFMQRNVPDYDRDRSLNDPREPVPNGPVAEARWRCDDGDSSPCSTERGSNYGECVTLFAPARNITSARIVTPYSHRDRLGGASDLVPAVASGTSFSAPIVGGVAARYLSMAPTLTAGEVYTAIVSTALENKLDPVSVNSPNLMVRAMDVAIIEQPVVVTENGGPATIRVRTIAAQNVSASFQWYRGRRGSGEPIDGQTGACMTVPVTDSPSPYWVAVTSSPCSSDDCRIESQAVFVSNSCSSPAIEVQPWALYDASGSVTLSVKPQSQTATVEWFRGAVGETGIPSGSSGTLANAMAGETYWARIREGACFADSQPITVEPILAPVFAATPIRIASPAPHALRSTVTLVAQTTAGTDLQYAWYSGTAVDSSLKLLCTTWTCSPSIDTAAGATFTVRAFNSTGEVTATITVPELCDSVPALSTFVLEEKDPVTWRLRLAQTYATYEWYDGVVPQTARPINSGLIDGGRGIEVPKTQQDNWLWVRVRDQQGGCPADLQYVIRDRSRLAFLTLPHVAGDVQLHDGTITRTIAVEASDPDEGTTKGSGFNEGDRPSRLHYEWHLGADVTGTPMGGDHPWLNVAQNDPHSYTIQVFSPDRTWSISRVYTPSRQPRTKIHPAEAIRREGEAITLYAPDYDVDGFEFDWYENSTYSTGTPISTAPTISPVLSAGTHYFWVREKDTVTGLRGDSEQAVVTVLSASNNPISITVDPEERIVGVNEFAILTASYAPAVSYQWFSGNGTAVPNGTAATVQVFPTDDTEYWVRIRDANDAVHDSDRIMIRVRCEQPTVMIVAQPASGGVTPNGSAVLTAQATGKNLHYDWFQGPPQNAVPFGSGASIRVDAPAVPTEYWVRAVDSCGFYADSAPITVRVCVPVLTREPEGPAGPIASGSSWDERARHAHRDPDVLCAHCRCVRGDRNGACGDSGLQLSDRGHYAPGVSCRERDANRSDCACFGGGPQLCVVFRGSRRCELAGRLDEPYLLAASGGRYGLLGACFQRWRLQRGQRADPRVRLCPPRHR